MTEVEYEIELDVLLMLLYQDRINHYKGDSRMSATFWSIIVQCRNTKEFPDRHIHMIEQLAMDEFIMPSDNPEYAPQITDSGVKFILDNGGYTKTKKWKAIEEETKQLTLGQLKRSKAAFIISLVAIVLSTGALVVAIITLVHKWQSP